MEALPTREIYHHNYSILILTRSKVKLGETSSPGLFSLSGGIFNFYCYCFWPSYFCLMCW